MNSEETHKCAYCGEDAKYQLKNGKWCCHESPNSCQVNKMKNSHAIKKAHEEGRCGNFTMSEDAKNRMHDGQKRGNQTKRKNAVENAFKMGSGISRGALCNYMVKDLGIEYKCAKCGIQEWMGEEIHLQVHHIDGNGFNNELSNLQLLCPNCHSQTDTYAGRNINNGKQKVSDEEFVNALKTNKSIRQALLSLGLDPKGGNYIRAYKLKMEHNIQ